MHVHLAAALTHDAHDAGVRDGGFDAEGAVVEPLEPLVVALQKSAGGRSQLAIRTAPRVMVSEGDNTHLFGVHLDLQRINVQQLRPLLGVLRDSVLLEARSERGGDAIEGLAKL